MTLGKPSGPLDAELVFVARDYGFEEAQAGRPLVGASGKIFDRALAKAGIERGRCLVTNVVNARPVGNKWEAHREQNIEAGLEQLREVLIRTPRRLIVAFGAEAFQACRGVHPRDRLENSFDGNGITELRGYVFEGPFGPVLAATHPAFVLRTWLPWWPLLCWDLAKAKRYLDGVVGKGSTTEYVESEAVVAMQNHMYSKQPVALDIETAGEHAEVIKCLGFAWDAEDGYAFSLPVEGRWDVELAEFLAGPAPKIFHNGQFDVTILERHGFTVRNWTDDTMLMWHCVEPLLAGKKKESGDQTQKSLRFLASLLLDEPWWKSYDFATEDDQLRLCARDARVTWACWHELNRRLSK